MPRVRNGVAHHRRKKRIFKLVRGQFGKRSKCWRTAQETLRRGGNSAFRDRRRKKREFRSLWIIRIGAAAVRNGLNYSRLINGLRRAGVDINRKMLSEVAIRDPQAFTDLAETAKVALRG